jgi:hypothetical protein
MEILKEVTQWNVDYRQPNHTYLVNKKGQIVAYAKWHSNEIDIINSRHTLNKRYRKFVVDNHKGLSKLIPQFISEDNEKKEKVIFSKSNNIRRFKVKSKDREYIVEFNKISKNITCQCIGYSYRRKCKHADAVSKLVITHSHVLFANNSDA